MIYTRITRLQQMVKVIDNKPNKSRDYYSRPKWAVLPPGVGVDGNGEDLEKKSGQLEIGSGISEALCITNTHTHTMYLTCISPSFHYVFHLYHKYYVKY